MATGPELGKNFSLAKVADLASLGIATKTSARATLTEIYFPPDLAGEIIFTAHTILELQGNKTMWQKLNPSLSSETIPKELGQNPRVGFISN